MNRKQFFSSLATLPFPFLKEAMGPIQRPNHPVVICIGTFGRMVWNQLIINRTNERFYFARSGYLTVCLHRYRRPKKVILVSGLDEMELSETLDVISFFERGYGQNISGFFTYPEIAEGPRFSQAQTMLTRVSRLMGSVRIANESLGEMGVNGSDAVNAIVSEILSNCA